MSTISSLGVGSGLDAETIIAKLMSIEHRQVDLLQTKQTEMKSQLSTVGTLKSLLSTMQDKAQALTSTSLWGQTTVSSSDATVATGTTATGTATGSYQVTVQALAASQTVTSTALASSSTELNEGSLTIQLGSWSGSSFTAKTGSAPVSITIGAGDTSLSAIRDKINAAGAGVTATIVNDVNGARLSLRSTDSGAVNGFKITAAETTDDGDDATGLSMLGYDPSVGTPPMSLNQAGSNARALINGIQVESASNTLSNVSDGLSLTLNKVSATPVQLTVATDTSAIKTAVNDFITAFNALASNLQTNLKYDSGTKKAGALQGDRMAVNLQWGLRGVINQPSSASSVFSTLSSIGITMQQDGKLKLASSDFDDALSNQTELKKMLTANTGVAGTTGFMTRFDDLAAALLDTEGSVTMREDGLQKAIDRNQKQQDAMEDRLTLTEKRLRAQYETLDTKMATLSTLASYVTRQFSS
ncbi:flagellar filament capping protein FliD [Ideonella alba]|uniref:Flagellar hook-associated protein 2 n=1 Tax=Ideonella alba TaxID=2824118 RepID=A0A941BAE6_9BURK|nr:flagellar filament capping protein FliD [Ideonella alba]MBQ0929730.1 flagellar filament capping protein FliD [Ideonella alba]